MRAIGCNQCWYSPFIGGPHQHVRVCYKPSYRPHLAPCVGISSCNNVKCGGPAPIYTLNSVVSFFIISLTPWTPETLGNGMFVVQISLLIVIFLSLISRILCKPSKKLTHTLALHNLSICGVSSSSSYATCWMLVRAYATSPRKAKWSGPHQHKWEENEFKSIVSHAPLILQYHASMFTLQVP